MNILKFPLGYIFPEHIFYECLEENNVSEQISTQEKANAFFCHFQLVVNNSFIRGNQFLQSRRLCLRMIQLLSSSNIPDVMYEDGLLRTTLRRKLYSIVFTIQNYWQEAFESSPSEAFSFFKSEFEMTTTLKSQQKLLNNYPDWLQDPILSTKILRDINKIIQTTPQNDPLYQEALSFIKQIKDQAYYIKVLQKDQKVLFSTSFIQLHSPYIYRLTQSEMFQKNEEGFSSICFSPDEEDKLCIETLRFMLCVMEEKLKIEGFTNHPAYKSAVQKIFINFLKNTCHESIEQFEELRLEFQIEPSDAFLTQPSTL